MFNIFKRTTVARNRARKKFLHRGWRSYLSVNKTRQCGIERLTVKMTFFKVKFIRFKKKQQLIIKELSANANEENYNENLFSFWNWFTSKYRRLDSSVLKFLSRAFWFILKFHFYNSRFWELKSEEFFAYWIIIMFPKLSAVHLL